MSTTQTGSPTPGPTAGRTTGTAIGPATGTTGPLRADGLHVVKAHGTGNDFVVLVDPDDTYPLAPAVVAALCDRRRGLGADGVIRAVRADVDGTDGWFMDHVNSDGSTALMCGNGVRVMAHCLVDAGLVEAGTATLPVMSRSGPRPVRLVAGGYPVYSVDMGPVGVDPVPVAVVVRSAEGERRLPGLRVDVGNPHVVVDVGPGHAVDGVLLLDRPSMRDRGNELGVGHLARVGTVDTLHPVLGHEDRLGVDLERPEGGGGVGGEERVARTRSEDHDPTVLEVAHRLAADVGLGHLGDRDRGLHPGDRAGLLEGILKGQGVENRGQHPHVVARGPVHAGGGAGEAAVNVAAAHDDGHLHPAIGHQLDLLRDGADPVWIRAVLEVAHEGLTRQLEKDPAELRPPVRRIL